MRVLIAVPTFETILPDTFQSIWDMEKPCECDFRFVRGYDCATARNKIADAAIDGGYDFVLMVDSDMTLPRNALTDLMSHDVDVASGWYLRRSVDTMQTNAFRLHDDGGRAYYGYPHKSAYSADELRGMDGPVRVHGTGMGCCLIRTTVFRRLPYPWFDWVNYADRHGMLSEDLYFCSALAKAGIPLYVDPRVACGHMFRRIKTP